MVLAFTVVPVELRLPTQRVLLEVLSLNFYPIDIAANVLGYVPLGIALRNRRAWVALSWAGLLSVSAETAQLFTVGRMPAVADVVANVLGAALGLRFATRRQILPEAIHIAPRHALMSAVAAVAFVAVGSDFTVEAGLRQFGALLEAPPWMRTNPRGLFDAGGIEAKLSFDRIENETIDDVSPNRLQGVAVNGPTLVPGVDGSAVSLNGQQWIDLGNPVPLRLTGSMTLSAWVNATRFPEDDAAIISSLAENELGYQLDLTIDQGPRTIGLKVGDASGRLMARYGKTPIVAGRWHYVAGVYDSERQTLDVYLDGTLDNGCLMGDVTYRQRASGQHTFVGRRAGMNGFEFVGSIDEAEIQSRANPRTDVLPEGDSVRYARDGSVTALGPNRGAAEVCSIQRSPRVAGPLVLLGMLITLACAGLMRETQYGSWALGVCILTASTASFWWSVGSSLGTLWLPILCVPLGCIIVLAARIASRRGSAN